MLEAKLSALRMRRDVLVGLEEAAQLDTLPNGATYPDETINPEPAERFAAAFAENAAGWRQCLKPKLPD
jgi:hypothetical protein